MNTISYSIQENSCFGGADTHFGCEADVIKWEGRCWSTNFRTISLKGSILRKLGLDFSSTVRYIFYVLTEAVHGEVHNASGESAKEVHAGGVA